MVPGQATIGDIVTIRLTSRRDNQFAAKISRKSALPAMTEARTGFAVGLANLRSLLRRLRAPFSATGTRIITLEALA
jgi:hypothetical protein